MIVDASDDRRPSRGGPGIGRNGWERAPPDTPGVVMAAPAPSAEELKLREELESLKRENAKLKAPASLCAEDASLLDALL